MVRLLLWVYAENNDVIFLFFPHIASLSHSFLLWIGRIFNIYEVHILRSHSNTVSGGVHSWLFYKCAALVCLYLWNNKAFTMHKMSRYKVSDTFWKFLSLVNRGVAVFKSFWQQFIVLGVKDKSNLNCVNIWQRNHTGSGIFHFFFFFF